MQFQDYLHRVSTQVQHTPFLECLRREPRSPTKTRAPFSYPRLSAQGLVAVGSTERQEFEDFVAGSMELVKKLSDAGVKAQFMSLEGKAHKDTALALGDSLSPLSQAVVGMILGT